METPHDTSPEFRAITSRKFVVESLSGFSSSTAARLEALVHADPVLISIHGKDCVLLEDICDEICVDDASGSIYAATTTSHPDESLEEVIEFARMFASDEHGTEVEIVRL